MTSTTGFEKDNVGFFTRKDPDAVLNYTVDYTSHLQSSDTLATATVTADTGLTVASSSIVTGNKKVTMNLSGGTVGTTYTVKIQCTTNDSLTLVHRFRVKSENAKLK